MKMKLLTAATLAALGATGVAQAVHVNPDGLGQVLLYPYYTVQGGFDTYVHVVNTTDTVKAVKVRFLEGKNSQEVLDFNLYLSPYDEWTAALSRSATGTLITTADTSCTAPAIPAGGVEFRNTLYKADSVNGTDRTREGYLEIIEMGEVTNAALITAATHVNGVPKDCAAVRTAANPGGNLNSHDPAYITIPGGGLYGFNTLINVEAGEASTIDAVAIDSFAITGDLHTPPGDELPSLGQVDNAATVMDGVTPVAFSGTGVDNVSALLMHDSIANDYVVTPGIAGATDWIVTFPTKRFYVNQTPVVAPFENSWDKTKSQSCDSIGVAYWDREERGQVASDDDFSPRPAGDVIALCNEVNTISFNADSIFGAEFTHYTLNVDYTEGWASMSFNSTNALAGLTDGATTFIGLPVIGFSAMRFANGTLQVDGVNILSNYGGTSVHKGSRSYQ
jgi:hypothetical protein